MAGFYLHIPFCKTRCAYCDFYSQTNTSLIGAYVRELEREICALSARFPNKKITTIYFGGGTPGLLSGSEVRRLIVAICSHFDTDLQEVTLEVNPASVRHLADFREAGVNRLSVGVQSLNNRTLELILRHHTAEEALSTLKEAKNLGFCTSADLILGLPTEGEGDIAHFVREVSPLVNHISAYLLKVEEGTPLARMKAQGVVNIADDDRLADLYDFAVAELASAGFERYEISNFAKAGVESVHNNLYWQMEEYFGAGAAAHAFLDGKRFFNTPNLDKYLAGEHAGNHKEVAEDDILTLAERKDEAVMLALRTRRGLNILDFKNRFNADFYQKYAKGFKKMQKYLVEHNGFISIGDKYLLLENEILANLLQ